MIIPHRVIVSIGVQAYEVSNNNILKVPAKYNEEKIKAFDSSSEEDANSLAKKIYSHILDEIEKIKNV